jgi:hypothetical protein
MAASSDFDASKAKEEFRHGLRQRLQEANDPTRGRQSLNRERFERLPRQPDQ